MISTFAWLDFSDRDRRRAMDVINLFRDEEARDELGNGVIRDAFADRLFPGTSTIQTRVRYFLFIPWLFQRLKTSDAPPERFAWRIREFQDWLRASLIEGGEEKGVIGSRAGRDVQRLPSNIYWNGLKRWGILRFPGSESDYARELVHQRDRASSVRNDDGEPVDPAEKGLWDPRLPDPPEGWLDETTFDLTPEEAEYLTHRIGMAAPGSLLDYFLHLKMEPEESAFAWEHLAPDQLPPTLREELSHARNFSESMHGASLLYNLMLAEEKQNEERVNSYEDAIAEWWQVCQARAPELAVWDRLRFWGMLAGWGASIRVPTHNFVEAWLHLVSRTSWVEDVLGSRDARSLIRAREQALKGPRARLGNPRALNDWSGSSGTAQLDYRWKNPVRDLLGDLLRIPERGA